MKLNVAIITLCTVLIVLSGWAIERGFGASDKATHVENKLAVHEAGQTEREKMILSKLDEIKAELADIKQTLRGQQHGTRTRP